MAEESKQLLLNVKNPADTQRRKKVTLNIFKIEALHFLMGPTIKNQNASEFIFSFSIGVHLVLMKW